MSERATGSTPGEGSAHDREPARSAIRMRAATAARVADSQTAANPARSAESAREIIEAAYRAESRRALATLVRLLGDFDLAEEALHEAFTSALEQWPRAGVPASPRAWLVSTGRFKAIDALRRRARFDASLATLARRIEQESSRNEDDELVDDRLRLIFLCCHPLLTPEARIALTLREVCGLTTEEIARAFLQPPPAIAQRIVRAKARIREQALAHELPPLAELPQRLDSVLRVVYLVFNEGWSASSGPATTRHDLSAEAIRLARLLAEWSREPEVRGLLALMLLHDSRRAARATPAGELVLLDDQDRSLWNRAQIAEGAALVEGALRSGRFGAYTLQAAIAAVHAEAQSAAATDWPQIAGLYDLLLRVEASPVIELNRALAIAMRDGPAAGLALLDALLARGELDAYLPAHAARADLCHRLGCSADARVSWQRALELARQEPERRYFEQRLRATPSAY
jgi:RNA polymerase sigma-70 factor (ECF subfamily)